MPTTRAMRLLNAVGVGTTTGAQLQTLLDDPGRKSEWQQLLEMRGQVSRMAASSTAMAAVIASSTAMAAVIASSTAMTAVIASSTAMAAVAASSTAMTAVAASSTARNAVWGSDVALTAIAGSSTAIAAIKAAATYAVNSTASVAFTPITTSLSGKYIMVGWSDSAANATTTIAGRRAGSTVGTLAGTSIAVGSTAATNNVMALESPVTVKIDTASTTVYLGVLPV